MAAFFGLILRGIKGLLRGIKYLWKKIWKYLLGLVIIGIIIGCISAIYCYYYYTYLPEQERKKARIIAERITSHIHTKDDSVNAEWAHRILYKETTWHEQVDDKYITEQLESVRSDALAVIESAAFNGNPKWQYILGDIYLLGENADFRRFSDYYVESDFDKSTYWYNEAAKQGYISAYYKLWLAYKEGRGVNVNMRKAVDFLQKGAEAGSEVSQLDYGDLFVEGVKIKVGSHTETRKTTKSFEHDEDKIRKYWDDDLMEYVKVYRVTIDDSLQLIPRDIEQAKFWWRKAAEQGNETAKNRLQRIYE